VVEPKVRASGDGAAEAQKSFAYSDASAAGEPERLWSSPAAREDGGIEVRLLTLVRWRVRTYSSIVAADSEIEFIFEPQEEGGYYAYAPDLPGLHTQGDTLEEARANAEEALALYVEGLQEAGRPLRSGVIR
jgi:predicted RNase H-like HicB family nuclease